MAIDGDERPVTVAAEAVHGLGEERLAGAPLAGDQHGLVRGGGAGRHFENGPHLGVFRHQHGLEPAGADGGAEGDHLVPEPLPFVSLAEGRQHLFSQGRRPEEPIGSFPERGTHAGRFGGNAADQNDAGTAAAPIAAEEVEAAIGGEGQIAEDRPDPRGLGFEQGGLGIAPGNHLVANVFQVRRDRMLQRSVGIEQEHSHPSSPFNAQNRPGKTQSG